MASPHEAGTRFPVGGAVALIATAVAGAAMLFFLRPRAAHDVRARIDNGDLGRRLHAAVDEAQRLAERGVALFDRAAGAVRQAGSRVPMLDARGRTEG